MTSRVAAIILAAGGSTRYRAAGGALPTKLVAPLDGAPLVARVADAALASQAGLVIVVTGYARASVDAALEGRPLMSVHNEDYAAGLSTSLRCGLAALPADVKAAIVLLADMPRVSPPLIDALIACAAEHPDADAIVPIIAGERGNPVVLNRSLFAAAATLTGDEGARRLLRHPAVAVIELSVTDEAVRLDIDDPVALAAAGR
ncbi:nucleotidyltransferase family protein [Lichenihabitans psoromatis]|uniref:nucleotidyltransferase family protein n=1 Tax=Lichenihabitans psoromatis TaxID=2528642 RepID=UPI001FE01C76|nr:nucleotidyltransferase family protein [Lichenihabitans psoromatis]